MHFQINADVSLTSSPVINASGVFAREGWLFGAQATFDTASNKAGLFLVFYKMFGIFKSLSEFDSFIRALSVRTAESVREKLEIEIET